MKMLDVLQSIRNTGKMVTIYGDAGDHDYSFTGYIQAVNESGLLLSKQNHGGYPNGFVFFTDIEYFETDTIDTRRHERLYALRGCTPPMMQIDEKPDLLEALLQRCYDDRLFCNIFKKEDDEGDALGFISEMYEDYIVLTAISSYGEYYGKCYIDKSDIFRLFIEGEYEQTVRILYDASK